MLFALARWLGIFICMMPTSCVGLIKGSPDAVNCRPPLSYCTMQESAEGNGVLTGTRAIKVDSNKGNKKVSEQEKAEFLNTPQSD